MGLEVEFNSILALRAWGTEERDRDETIPDSLTLEGFYNFQKSGYRVYPLNKPIPLVITEGDGNFIKIVGLAEIKRLKVEMGSNGKLLTTGTFKFISEISKEWTDISLQSTLLQLST